LFWSNPSSTMLGRMRRNGLLIGGWAMATLLALVLGLQGIQSVSNSVTDHRPAPLSPASVRAALQRTSTSSTTTTAVSAASGSSAASDDPARSASSSGVVSPRVNGDGGSTASDGPSPAVDGSVAPSASTDSSEESAESGPGPDSSSSSESSSESSAPFVDRIYQLEGGSVAVRFQDNAAHLLWATPNRDEGFTVDQAEENGGTVDVRFRNDDHESRLRAYWDDGPRDEIEENSEG